ncbi:hypothetical protein ACSBR2_015889 [Camellia fascicularis]
MVWAEDLVDVQQFSTDGNDLFLRLAYSELGKIIRKEKKITIIFTTIYVVILLGAFMFGLPRWRANQRVKRRKRIKGFGWGDRLDMLRDPSQDHATHSESSEPPMLDFDKHRNLVRLLGYCIDGEEKLLVYEYMTNRSLDTFLFDAKKRMQLDRAKHFNIIQGIAREILYLHRDSCLRVIHRDLKASNILLDDDMNPKISNFGLARTFQLTQELANTHRVMGTFGYMSPEYATGGLFSEKSDVFSFSVLLLEIVSGTRNTSLHYNEKYLNLLVYAWQLCNKNRELELMDEAMAYSCSRSEVMRCIHIELLCVQDHVADRLTMSAVVLMLSSEMDLPQPKQPTFTIQSLSDADLLSLHNKLCSMNAIVIWVLVPEPQLLFVGCLVYLLFFFFILFCSQECIGLLSYAWQLWNEERALDFIDHALDLIRITLQIDHVVVVMLNCETEGPQPKQTMFTFQSFLGSHLGLESNNKLSINEVRLDTPKIRKKRFGYMFRVPSTYAKVPYEVPYAGEYLVWVHLGTPKIKKKNFEYAFHVLNMYIEVPYEVPYAGKYPVRIQHVFRSTMLHRLSSPKALAYT